MSCSGCRVLRKGCSDGCILRSSLQWIESAEAQGHATVFVAKFFGRAGMLSFINAVAESQRPALFQSLLYEACGRTVNPVFGAVGLLWSGNWGICQAAVETVLKGGSLKPAACPPLTDSFDKPQGNPPLKRPLSLTVPTINPNTPAKRAKSSITQQELPELRGDVHLGHANTDIPACLLETDTDTSKTSEILGSSETPKQAQRPATGTQLVVPVARRAKPPVGFEFASKYVVRGNQQGPSFQEQVWKSNKAIELNLSLNSLAFGNASSGTKERQAGENERESTHDEEESRGNHIALENSMGQEEEHASCMEAGRSSSPCSFSINSEDSVATVDTTEVSISGVQTFIGNRFRQENYHLLHLL